MVYCEAISSVEVKQFLLLFLCGPSVNPDPPGCRWLEAQLLLVYIGPCNLLKLEAKVTMSCPLGLDSAPVPMFHLCFPLCGPLSSPVPPLWFPNRCPYSGVCAPSCAGARRMTPPTSSTCEVCRLWGHGLSAQRPGALSLFDQGWVTGPPLEQGS